MIKRLCDICGKEIISDGNKYKITIESHSMTSEYLTALPKYITVIPDVCSDCANSIYHYIEGLKKPLDKLTEL